MLLHIEGSKNYSLKVILQYSMLSDILHM